MNIKPKYYDGIKLKKGKYHIKVSKKGYSTVKKWINLEKDESFTAKLEKKNSPSYINMSYKERKNYKTCIDGRYPTLCNHSWLTSSQAKKVRAAERRAK
jgi:uncharacterized membrane protein